MSRVFEPVQRQSIRDKVCTAIRDAIFRGDLKLGERLREIHLSKELQVSRSVIREAFQQLAHEGMITLVPFRGAHVVDLTSQQLDEIIGLRLILEAEAVRLAKAQLRPADAEHLRRIAAELEHARATPERFARLDFELHQTIWELSRNETLVKHLSILTAPMFSLGVIMRYSPAAGVAKTPVHERLGDHTNLINGICEGTADEAVETIRNHLTENWAYTRAAIDKLHAPDGDHARSARFREPGLSRRATNGRTKTHQA